VGCNVAINHYLYVQYWRDMNEGRRSFFFTVPKEHTGILCVHEVGGIQVLKVSAVKC
jgi:hypothetical protein